LVAIAGFVKLGIAVLGATAMIALFSFLVLGVMLDPQLIILVDNGNGGTAWISVLTWFD
jgi:hypothetical protein